jgi:hypothetical protein
MGAVLKLISIWGLGDALFLAFRPSGWGRFWTKGVSTISGDRRVAAGVACLQVIICLWMIRKSK